mmetsp:Transcript_21609/g.48280  ORF Transcript_21609/g.48280 Transcript_21609/m.48280 type:complete len:232 (-) Transcript_21609:570-1265(-)
MPAWFRRLLCLPLGLPRASASRPLLPKRLAAASGSALFLFCLLCLFFLLHLLLGASFLLLLLPFSLSFLLLVLLSLLCFLFHLGLLLFLLLLFLLGLFFSLLVLLLPCLLLFVLLAFGLLLLCVLFDFCLWLFFLGGFNFVLGGFCCIVLLFSLFCFYILFFVLVSFFLLLLFINSTLSLTARFLRRGAFAFLIFILLCVLSRTLAPLGSLCFLVIICIHGIVYCLGLSNL